VFAVGRDVDDFRIPREMLDHPGGARAAATGAQVAEDSDPHVLGSGPSSRRGAAHHTAVHARGRPEELPH
jgi:hypothetical protein